MAKKKTAPILRAQSGGEQPTPETPIITKSYSVRDDWKDRDIVNYVAFKSVDGEVQNLTVNGQPAGGGGASATVQITNSTSGKGVFVRGPVIVDNLIMVDIHENNTWTISRGSSASFTVPLASNGTQFYVNGIPDPTQVTMTGGCRWDDVDDTCFIITGDCTITI